MCVSQLTDFPFTHSVARELEAMAEPQPKVLNRASTIFPWSSTSICPKQFDFKFIPSSGLNATGKRLFLKHKSALASQKSGMLHSCAR